MSQYVRDGDIMAWIADTGQSRTNIMPHLHFSFGRPASDIGYEPFVWNHMRDPGLVTLNNPQSLIDWPTELLGYKSQDLIFTSVGTEDIT